LVRGTMRSWVKEGERPGQKDWASANGGCTHQCTYNSRKRGAGPLLVMSARNQEKPNSSPGLALLETASPLRLMGPKWSALGCPLNAFIGKAALPDIGLQCSQPHLGSEHGQRPPTTSPKGDSRSAVGTLGALDACRHMNSAFPRLGRRDR